MSEQRQFTDSPAVRSHVPLLVGLMGPSGGGKTYSALELATGIQEVTGGDIYGIDTESNRMLHYADYFKFRHVPFKAPFGSLDYLAAFEYCLSKGAKIIITDSMSHEHEGPGGLLDFWESEQDRMAGNDWSKRDRIKMLAIQKPKQHRRRLINTMLQMDCNFISCFRAKETAKPMKVAGKTEVVQLGFMPIAGDEFVFEQTVNCLLLPNAKGVPTWLSENVGERTMMKLPEQFKDMFTKDRRLDRTVGKELALWARGPAKVEPDKSADKPPRPIDELTAAGDSISLSGLGAYQKWFSESLTRAERKLLVEKHTAWKAIAEKAGP